MANKIILNPTGNKSDPIYQGFPIGVSKIIQGDLRERTWIVDGKEMHGSNNTGVVLYDREAEQQEAHRPWFILILNTGARDIIR